VNNLTPKSQLDKEIEGGKEMARTRLNKKRLVALIMLSQSHKNKFGLRRALIPT